MLSACSGEQFVILLFPTVSTWLADVKGDQKPIWITMTNPVIKVAQTTALLIPTTPSVCIDKITNCGHYGDKTYACKGQYEQWARINCAKYCGYCSQPTTTILVPTTSSVCVDKITNCGHYGDKTYACKGQYEQWARINCAKYCGYCTVTQAVPTTALPMPTELRVCTDTISNCEHYGDKTYACKGQYEQWAKNNCAKYCGYCTVTQAVPTTALPMPTKLTVCTDKISNCGHYGDKSYACKGQYEKWARSNCAKYCGYCIVSPALHSNVSSSAHPTIDSLTSHSTVPSTKGLCVYKGKHYVQDDIWNDGCQYNCTCVNAQTGRWSCDVVRCPSLKHAGKDCVLEPPGYSECCPTLHCHGHGHHQK